MDVAIFFGPQQFNFNSLAFNQLLDCNTALSRPSASQWHDTSDIALHRLKKQRKVSKWQL